MLSRSVLLSLAVLAGATSTVMASTLLRVPVARSASADALEWLPARGCAPVSPAEAAGPGLLTQPALRVSRLARAAARRAVRAKMLEVFHLVDLVLELSARRLNHSDISNLLADQRPSDRRHDGQLVGFDISFIFSDDLEPLAVA